MTITQLVRPMWLMGLRFAYKLRHIPIGCYAWVLNHVVPRTSYNLIDEMGLRERCRGDTLFILGSGASLAQLDKHQIHVLSCNTTMSFNYTAIQALIPVDFHLVREVLLATTKGKKRTGLGELGALLSTNTCYQNAIFLIQSGFNAWGANLFFAGNYLRKGCTIFRYLNAKSGGKIKLRDKFEDGIVHGASTVIDCINVGAILGFRHIVLCGVDLYDRKYFWNVPGVKVASMPSVTAGLDEEYSGKATVNERHRTGSRLIEQIVSLKDDLSNKNINLWVQNPKSLLTQVLPVYTFSKSES